MADENSEGSCDIDLLTSLLEEDHALSHPTVAASTSNKNEEESDVLKKKLAEMERQMAELKEQLNQKNNATQSTPFKDAAVDFSQPTQQSSTSLMPVESTSLVHQGDSESSEDEEGNKKTTSSYNEFGQFVKQRLAHQPLQVDRLKSKDQQQGWKSKQGALTNLTKPEAPIGTSSDNGFTDPFFGIKILSPLIGSTALAQRMEGRKQIRVSQIRSQMRGGDIQDDWVTLAVIVSKGEPRTSQNGKKYAIWKLSDLKDCSKTASFFLFGQVFTAHWKMAVGSVIGLLNPNFMKDSASSEEVSFTIDNPQKVLHVGGSKDLGWCRATRKDGSRCPSFVNKSECEFCIYHVQNEFKKSSAKRSEIQSSFSGTGLSTKDRLKQKVLGKQEVFYGGQLFTNKVVAPPASKVKDNKILSSLKMQNQAQRLKEEEAELARSNVKTEFSERLKNPTAGARNLMRCMDPAKAVQQFPQGVIALHSSPAGPSARQAMKSITAQELLQQHKQQMQVMQASQQKTPQLGRGIQEHQDEIDLCEQVSLAKPNVKSHPRLESAKLKALKLVRLKGPLNKADPNSPSQKPKTPELQAKVRKRISRIEDDDDNAEGEDEARPKPSKRSKAELDGLMEARSSHAHLVDQHEAQQSEQYFNKLERKEQMETKMLGTFEIKTTAVSCSKCNYTALSASELCRREGHPLKSIKAVKRFFQCKDCKQRTITLDRLPKRACNHCGSSNWEKAAMAKERKGPVLPHEELLLRGEERPNLNT